MTIMQVCRVLSKRQAINYSVTREKAPVYTMGSPDARAYSRNKRGIAGSLIWINFDRHSLLNFIQKCAGTFVADIDEIRPQYSQVSDGGAVFSSSVARAPGITLPVGSTIDYLDNTLASAGQNVQLASPWYSDQVLPFDVTLSGANEYGAMCAAKIFGLKLLNEGFGISIDDAFSEMQAKPGLSLVISHLGNYDVSLPEAIRHCLLVENKCCRRMPASCCLSNWADSMPSEALRRARVRTTLHP